MSPDIENAEIYRARLEALVQRYASRPVHLFVVDDIEEWASKRSGNVKGNPPATSVVDSKTGAWGIVIRRCIDRPWMKSIIDRVELSGIQDSARTLSKPEVFLRHLVLHELAHLENGWGQERENDCDVWAYERLKGEQ